MGVKVSKVKDSHTLKEITVDMCEDGYSGEYICLTNGCNAKMSFVKSHEKRRLDKTLTIPGFFKLKSKHEKHHETKCGFDTKGAIKVIVRKSDKNILKSIADKKYEFSLQILYKPKNIASPNTSPTDDEESKINKTYKKTKKYSNQGTASSYINTLNQILILRSKIEDSSELEESLVLKHQKNSIPWNKFYFDMENYMQANRYNDGLKIDYPICIHGNILKVINKTDKFKYDKLKLHNPFIELNGDITLMPKIELILNDKNIDLADFSKDTEVLIYGKPEFSESNWIPYEEKEKDKPKTIKFLTIKIWINHSKQIMILKS